MRSIRSVLASASAALAATVTVFGTLLAAPQVSQAASSYCVYSSGKRVCLDSVFGPRSNRRIYFTVNGVLFVSNQNCYIYDYQPTSITGVACWAYEALSKGDTARRAEQPGEANPAAPETVVKTLKTATEPVQGNTISPGAIQKQMPAEVKK
jgi:hypothetical protein